MASDAAHKEALTAGLMLVTQLGDRLYRAPAGMYIAYWNGRRLSFYDVDAALEFVLEDNEAEVIYTEIEP